MNTPVEQAIAVWFTSTVLGFAALGCTENSAASGDASVGSVTDGENKPDAQAGFVPEGGNKPDAQADSGSQVANGHKPPGVQVEIAGEYEADIDAESLEALGITTLVAPSCVDPLEGEEPENNEWSFAVHQDWPSYAAAHEIRQGYGSPREVDFETHVVIEVYAGEWGGCGEYVELTGARDAGDVIEVDARYVAVCGDDSFNLPFLFASAPRVEKPYVVVQQQPRCPPCHSGGEITLRCRNEQTRRCSGGGRNCGDGHVRALPLSSSCSHSDDSHCPDGEGCLAYAGMPLDTEAGCWRSSIVLDCTPLPAHCLASGVCDDPHVDGVGCYIELATGKQLKSWDQNLTGNPRFRECTEEERAMLLDLPSCD